MRLRKSRRLGRVGSLGYSHGFLLGLWRVRRFVRVLFFVALYFMVCFLRRRKVYKEVRILLSHYPKLQFLRSFKISYALLSYQTLIIRPVFHVSTTQDALLKYSRIRSHPLPLRQQRASTSNHPLQRWPMHPARDRLQARRQHRTRFHLGQHKRMAPGLPLQQPIIPWSRGQNRRRIRCVLEDWPTGPRLPSRHHGALLSTKLRLHGVPGATGQCDFDRGESGMLFLEYPSGSGYRVYVLLRHGGLRAPHRRRPSIAETGGC